MTSSGLEAKPVTGTLGAEIVGLSGTDARKIYRRAEKISLVCIMALRKAHHDLWQQTNDTGDTPSSDTPSPPAP